MNLLHYLFWNWIYWAHIISQSAFYLSHLFFFSHLLLQLLNLSTELFHPPSLTGKYTLLLIFFTLCILDMSQSNIKWNFFTLFSDDAKGDSNLQFSPPHSSPVERYSSARRSPCSSVRVFARAMVTPDVWGRHPSAGRTPLCSCGVRVLRNSSRCWSKIVFFPLPSFGIFPS